MCDPVYVIEVIFVPSQGRMMEFSVSRILEDDEPFYERAIELGKDEAHRKIQALLAAGKQVSGNPRLIYLGCQSYPCHHDGEFDQFGDYRMETHGFLFDLEE